MWAYRHFALEMEFTFTGTVEKCQIASSPVYTCKLADGRHGIALFPEKGEIVLDVLEVDITNEQNK